jgi:phosphate starvation-inducible protein PhoH and related proteins
VILRHEFQPVDNTRLARVCGTLDENLRSIEGALNVQVRRREAVFAVEGRKADAQRAIDVLVSLHDQARRPIAPAVLSLLLEAQRAPPLAAPTSSGRASAAATSNEDGTPPDIVLHTRRPDLQARTPNQRAYLRDILEHVITFGIGPAGTGKTFLAVACAVDALERNMVQRIVLTRPAVEAGERLGFLPGDLAQKVDPYLRPLYDALYDLMGFDRVTRAFERGVLEIAPLAFMRGRTLNQAFVILDEAQNTTPEQMKMFLTRIGFGAKAVVTGDVSQIDLPRTTTSGLIDAAHVLAGVEGIAFTRFTSADVVRHPLVARMVDAYDRQRRQEEDRAAATSADAHRFGGSGGTQPRGGRARR